MLDHKGRKAEQRTSRAASETLELLVARWPSLPALAFGLWLAWSGVAFSGSTWLSLDVETNANNLSVHYVFVTFAMAFALVACPLASRHSSVKFDSNRAVIGAGALASAMCLVVILIGPHYLGTFMTFTTVFRIVSIVIGVCMGIILLRCGVIYGGLSPRDSIIEIGASLLLSAFIFFFMYGCPSWAPIEGGPTLAGILTYVLLPLAAALLACVSPELERDGSGKIRERGTWGRAGVRYEGEARRLPRSYWRLVALSFIVGLVVMMVHGTAVSYHALAVTTEGSRLIAAFETLLALVFILMGASSRAGEMRMGRVITIVILLFSSVIVIAAPMMGLQGGWSILVYSAALVFELLLWAMLSFVVKQKHVSPIIVFGYGYGAFLCGSAAGWSLGAWLVARLSNQAISSTIFVTCAAIMIVAAFTLFSEADFEQLFNPSSQQERPLSDLFDDDERARRYSAGDDQGKRVSKFRRAIADRSERCMLSARETDVFRMLAMGYGSDHIASELGLSVNTVRVHTHSVYVKLGVHSRTELMELVDADVAEQDAAV